MIVVFLFYNQAVGKQIRYTFSKEFKHANVMTYKGDRYLLSELSSYGYQTRIFKEYTIGELLTHLKLMPHLISIIIIWIEKPIKLKWRPLRIWSCNEHCRLMSGVDIGITLNPFHLYKKLLRYRSKRNYKILSHWRRKDGRFSK